jgi:hypothetical protein
MKALFMTIGLCIFVCGGCDQQFSNSDEVIRDLSEQGEYGISFDYENAGTRDHDGTAVDYGPRIDLVKAIWGD